MSATVSRARMLAVVTTTRTTTLARACQDTLASTVKQIWMSVRPILALPEIVLTVSIDTDAFANQGMLELLATRTSTSASPIHVYTGVHAET